MNNLCLLSRTEDYSADEKSFPHFFFYPCTLTHLFMTCEHVNAISFLEVHKGPWMHFDVLSKQESEVQAEARLFDGDKHGEMKNT